MSKSGKREAVVSLWRPGSRRSRAVFRASTIRKCEQWIAQREKTDPDGVHRGDYCIGGTPRAEWEYQRLRRNQDENK